MDVFDFVPLRRYVGSQSREIDVWVWMDVPIGTIGVGVFHPASFRVDPDAVAILRVVIYDMPGSDDVLKHASSGFRSCQKARSEGRKVSLLVVPNEHDGVEELIVYSHVTCTRNAMLPSCYVPRW